MGRVQGRCLCGAVRLEAVGDLPQPNACHCAMCRRWHGSPGVYSSAKRAHIQLTGEDSVAWYRSGEATERGFCSKCGTKLFWHEVGDDSLDFTTGLLESPTGLNIAKHIWVAFKGDYYDLADGLPQYAKSSRNAEPVAPMPAAGAPGPQARTGQCLCGAVKLKATGMLRDISVCHCGQCRRWHGHAPGYSKARWSELEVTGREHIAWYQSSNDARRGFCKTCGSSLFWERTGADAVSIPAGVFDGPTGLREKHHIFVADKGDCYEIADGLPQFEKSGGNALPF